MSIHRKIAATAAAVALGVAPAVAVAHGPGGSHANSQNAPGLTRAAGTAAGGGTSTNATTTNSGKAYGRLCQGESKKHVAGQSGTPFSTCVKDMARAAKTSNPNPHQICANESKKHVDGMKGTPYSQCVTAAAKLRGQAHRQTGSDSGTTSTSTTSSSGS